jgi:hypothetical protein
LSIGIRNTADVYVILGAGHPVVYGQRKIEGQGSIPFILTEDSALTQLRAIIIGQGGGQSDSACGLHGDRYADRHVPAMIPGCCLNIEIRRSRARIGSCCQQHQQA